MEILISAGEASADRYGAAVMEEVRRRRPEARFSGMGGPAMQAQGLETLADARHASVMGFSAVLRRLPALRRTFAALRERAESGRVQAAFLIDFPDFNLRLAAAARARGVPVVQMVAPQFWAWRPGRLRALPDLVSRLLCILPFEEETLRRAGVEARFIGHPLRDLAVPSAPTAEIRRRYRLPASAPLIGLVPGSRAGGVRRLLPRMVAAAVLLARKRGDLHFLLPVAPTLDRHLFEPRVAALGQRAHVREGSFTDLASCCEAAVASSGTATLELALLGVPSVIVYRVGGLLAPLARRFLRVEHVGLPNLVAGKRLLPERLQREFTPARVAADIEAWLADEAARRRLSEELRALRARLGEPGVLGRAAAHLLEVVA
jgi:lipid-A-disaccharide synthase